MKDIGDFGQRLSFKCHPKYMWSILFNLAINEPESPADI